MHLMQPHVNHQDDIADFILAHVDPHWLLQGIPDQYDEADINRLFSGKLAPLLTLLKLESCKFLFTCRTSCLYRLFDL